MDDVASRDRASSSARARAAEQRRRARAVVGRRAGMRVREWTGGRRSWPEEAETTSGEVLLYVVRGAIEVDLDGTMHVLSAGDALKFDGAVRHRVRRHGPVTTRALYVASG